MLVVQPPRQGLGLIGQLARNFADLLQGHHIGRQLLQRGSGQLQSALVGAIFAPQVQGDEAQDARGRRFHREARLRAARLPGHVPR